MRRPFHPAAFLALLMPALLLLSACSDSTSPNGGSPGGSQGGTTPSGIVMGKVLTINRFAASGVTVQIGALTTTTDANGEFIFFQVKPGSRVLVNIGGGYYTTTQKIVSVTVGRTTWVDAAVAQWKVQQSVTAAGGKVDFDGASVTFPANAFVDSKGRAFAGTATVKAAWFDPTNSWGIPSYNTFLGSFPGEFSGVRTNGSTTGIESFGFVSVELYNGTEKLQLASGTIATVTFPIPATLLNRAPATIPLWYYDLGKGLWIEEGQATRTGNNYVGTVSHFSTWNCDQPTQTSYLEGHVVDRNGKPLAFANVKHSGVDYTGGSTARTDETGYFKLAVKASSSADVWAAYYTHTSPAQRVSTPATGATLDIGTITLDVDPAEFSTVTGRVVDNGGLPVKWAYVLLKDSTGVQIDQIHVNDQARFQYFVDAGRSYIMTVTWVGDSAKNPASDVHVVGPAVGQILDIGDIKIDVGGATITGRVVDASGNPLANVSVYTREGSSPGGTGQREILTGADGKFSLWVRPSMTMKIYLYYNQQQKSVDATSGTLGSTTDIGDITIP